MSPGTSQAESGKHRPQWHRQKHNTEVLEATLAKDLQGVRRSLGKGGSADATCRELNVTACHLAALDNSLHILECLVDEGASLEARASDGCQPVHYAAWAGSRDVVQFILNLDKAFVNSVVEKTVLQTQDDHLDSWTHRHTDVQEKLPKDIPEGSTTTALLSSQMIDEDFINFLFHLHEEAERSELKERPPFVFQSNSPAMPQAQGPLEWQMTRRSLAAEEKELSLKDALLHALISQGNAEWVGFLLSEKSASPRAALKNGNTPIHEAVLKKDLAILRLLLQADPDAVNLQNSFGETPLHLAVKGKWSDALDVLLEGHQDMSIQDNNGDTVFHLASREETLDILQELLSCDDGSAEVLNMLNYDGYSCLYYATFQNSMEIVEILCRNQADTMWIGPKDETLLHVAVHSNNSILLEHFLKDANCLTLINNKTNEEDGSRTPLHCAAMKGQLELVKVLVRATGKLNIVETTGPKYDESTALHLAARAGHVSVVAFITDHNSMTVVEKDGKERYPLHVATLYLHKECVRELIIRGSAICFAVPDESTNKMRTGLDLIMKHIPEPIDFLAETLDHYLKPIKGTSAQPDCEIKIEFDFLVPDGDGPYIEDIRQMDVLDSILNSGSGELLKRLLLHPVIEAFLFLKWQKLKNFFLLLFLVYIGLTTTLTTFALLTYQYEGSPLTLYFLRLLLLVFIAIAGLAEAVCILRHQDYYIRDPETWLKCVILLLALFIAILPEEVTWGRYPASITVLLAWVLLLLLLSRFPRVGLIVLMFLKVSENILQVMATFSFLLIGFSFAFFIHFGGVSPFANLGETFSKVIIMMVEIDYVGAFEDDNERNPGDHEAAFIGVGRALYIFFSVLVVMVLTNLMVGLSVSDIAQLEREGRSQRMAKKASFLSSLELLVYNRRLTSCLSHTWKKSLVSLRSVSPTFLLLPYNDRRNPFSKRLTDLVLDSTFKRKKKEY